ncbi:MAG: hypothetical protein LBF93_04370 [Zoogloeaceae bacterium]|nr:hypothetical protein [Zoogloeaceae bacterium]
MSIDMKRADAILVRMRAEEAVDVSDAEIMRTLSGCVGGDRLVQKAMRLRDIGAISEKLLLESKTRAGRNDTFYTRPLVSSQYAHTPMEQP